MFGRKNKPDQNKGNVKTLSLSQEELASLSFFARCAKEREEEMYFWRAKAEAEKKAVLKRNAVDNGYIPDWTQALQTGRFTVTKAPEPVVVPGGKEEIQEG